MKASKQKIIGEILVEITKGNDRAKTLAINAEKWQLKVRTFDRYWKDAQQRFNEMQADNQELLKQANHQEAAERVKGAILTKTERMEIASKIARGEAWKVNTGNGGAEIIMPSAGDRLKALDYLSKVDGDFSPLKIDHTTLGNEINNDPLSVTEHKLTLYLADEPTNNSETVEAAS